MNGDIHCSEEKKNGYFHFVSPILTLLLPFVQINEFEISSSRSSHVLQSPKPFLLREKQIFIPSYQIVRNACEKSLKAKVKEEEEEEEGSL